MTREFSVRNHSANLRVTSDGSGPSMVMLHAGVADRRMWGDMHQHFSQKYCVTSYDRRGFGETSALDDPFSHTDDLRAVLDHHGEKPHILIGCSQGGRIAIDFALLHPDRVAALVLVSTAITGASPPSAYAPEISSILTRLDKAEEKDDTNLVNAIEAHLWLDGPFSEEGRVTGLSRELFLDMNLVALDHPELSHAEPPTSAISRLESLTVPTLLFSGDLDFPHIQQRTEWIADKIPQAQSIVMHDCAHLLVLEQPTKFNEIMEHFVAQVA